MSNSSNQQNLILGIFFVTALSILAFFTLFLTDTVTLFKDPILMTVYFPDGNLLKEGDPVQVLGARFGRVKEIETDPTVERRKAIRVVLNLTREIQLTQGATISIRESSLLGGRHVEIDPGEHGTAPLAAEEGAYYGVVYKNPIASLGQIGAVVEENRESLRNTMENVEAITASLRDGTGLLGMAISDEEVRTEAKQIVTDLADASAAMREGKGVLGAMIYDEELKKSLTSTFDRLERIGADLENQKGLLGSLIYDSSLRDRVVGGIDSIVDFSKRLNTTEGALGLLMNDKATRDQVQSMIADVSQASADIKAVMADVSAGKGSLGKLLKSDELFDEATKAVQLLTRSLEDYREAAPVTTFSTVLFGAF
jgi:phospholipid/cholesterol/gamma-HCH transport system substrate-binding protein